jgi:hypothetical protein
MILDHPADYYIVLATQQTSISRPTSSTSPSQPNNSLAQGSGFKKVFMRPFTCEGRSVPLKLEMDTSINTQWISTALGLRDLPALEPIPSIQWFSWAVYSSATCDVTKQETYELGGDGAQEVWEQAMKELTVFVCSEVMMKNQSYVLVVEGDWVMEVLLPVQSLRTGVKLGQHMKDYTNIYSVLWDTISLQKTIIAKLELT